MLEKTEYCSDEDLTVTFPLTENKFCDKDGDLSVVEENVQKALNETGFGKFNYKVIIVAGFICINASFSLTSVGFILPSTACYFEMTTIDKGRLSNAPIFGMMCGSFLWGYLSDKLGRKSPLLACLILQAICELLSSLVNNYWIIIVAKVISGFGIGGQIAILYTFMGEFQPSKYRLKALSTMEIFWIFGLIISPALAWTVIPLNFNIDYKNITLNSRNLFMIICSLPSWIIGFWLIFFPETPKFLAESGKIEELTKVLIRVHKENTGKSAVEYMEKLRSCGIQSIDEIVNKVTKSDKKVAISMTLKKIYQQFRIILMRPYLGRTIVVCGIMYCSMSALFTLMIWFPELFKRFSEYEKFHKNAITTVCIVSNSANSSLVNNNDIEECNELDSSVFSYPLIVGISCLPIATLFPLIVNRVGFKYSLVFCFLSSSVVTIGLFFIRSSNENLILLCIFQGLISISCTITFCVAVVIFPTHLRIAVSSLASLVGRAGALAGNTIFSYLIDSQCTILICLVAFELLVGGILAMLLPSDKQTSSESNDNNTQLELNDNNIQ